MHGQHAIRGWSRQRLEALDQAPLLATEQPGENAEVWGNLILGPAGGLEPRRAPRAEKGRALKLAAGTAARNAMRAQRAVAAIVKPTDDPSKSSSSRVGSASSFPSHSPCVTAIGQPGTYPPQPQTRGMGEPARGSAQARDRCV